MPAWPAGRGRAPNCGEEQEIPRDGERLVQVQFFAQGQEHGQVDQTDDCLATLMEEMRFLFVGSASAKLKGMNLFHGGRYVCR
jgi:hypothetical protein